jgi:hypothetical protein
MWIGSTDLIESGSYPDPDPKHWYIRIKDFQKEVDKITNKVYIEEQAMKTLLTLKRMFCSKSNNRF